MHETVRVREHLLLLIQSDVAAVFFPDVMFTASIDNEGSYSGVV